MRLFLIERAPWDHIDMIAALLAAALAAAPSFDVQLAMSIRGERVGVVHASSDGAQFRYRSLTVVRRDSVLSPQEFTTEKSLDGPLPSTVALWMFRDGVATCFEVEDEQDGKRGQVCGKREGRTLTGTLLGEPFTALLDGDGGPTTLELPRQQTHFERISGPMPLPAPRDLFSGSQQVEALRNLEGADRAHVRGASSECAMDEELERVAPEADERLGLAQETVLPARDLKLATRTRWSTAKAVARFVDAAIESVPASAADERPREVWKARKGSCVGQARLFAELAGAYGVPSRVVYGALVEDGRMAPHAWNEVEVGGRWYGVDASRGIAPVGPDHIPLARSDEPDRLRAGRCMLALPSMKWGVEPR